MKRKSKGIKKFVLWTITFIAWMLYVFSTLMIGTGESEYTILLIVSMVWLGIFALANGGMKIIKDAWYW